MAFTWLNPLNWLRAHRHLLARVVDTTDRKRQRWVELQAPKDPSGDFRLPLDLPERFSFLVLGDTGEGDTSQLVVVDDLLRVGSDTSFAVIVGDVVYPAGRSAAYRDRFYVPYRHYPHDIYAVPGQHDWYDELVGFMAHFCDTPVSPRDPSRRTVDAGKLERLRAIRRNHATQPNMYFHIDHPRVRIVGLDTGMDGRVDGQQLAWFRRVSAGPAPKILLLHAPVFVDGTRNRALDDVLAVTARGNYRLVIGGDTHNFQRYRIPAGTAGAPHPVEHLVNGGGGAYLMGTGHIPPVEEMDLGTPTPLGPDDFACYPSREASRRYYGRALLRRLPRWLLDADEPPYHKSFVKVAVEPDHLRVEVHVVETFATPGRATRSWRTFEVPTGAGGG